MAEDSKSKLPFVRPGVSQFEVMPFGLKCALSTFSRLIDRISGYLKCKALILYLDNISIFLGDVWGSSWKPDNRFDTSEKFQSENRTFEVFLRPEWTEVFGKGSYRYWETTRPKQHQAIKCFQRPQNLKQSDLSLVQLHITRNLSKNTALWLRRCISWLIKTNHLFEVMSRKLSTSLSLNFQQTPLYWDISITPRILCWTLTQVAMDWGRYYLRFSKKDRLRSSLMRVGQSLKPKRIIWYPNKRF